MGVKMGVVPAQIPRFVRAGDENRTRMTSLEVLPCYSKRDQKTLRANDIWSAIIGDCVYKWV